MNNPPLVSVIMPAYNAVAYIEQAVESVVSQTFTSWELIIVNDGSTDATASLLNEKYSAFRNIILVNQENKKQGAARNNGLRRARGKWIAFLDADDLWRPDKLEVQLRHAERADVIYTGGTILDEAENRSRAYPIKSGFTEGLAMFAELFEINRIPILSVLLKKEWVDRVGLQNEKRELAGCEDWEYWLRLARSGATFYGIANDLFVYRVHSSGTSRNPLTMQTAEIYAKYLNLDSRHLSAAVIRQHFFRRIFRLINRLLVANEKTQALELMNMLDDLKERKYELTRKVLRHTDWLHGKLILYLTQPGFAASVIRRKLLKK
jgi:teichuronic acid biosynthesis glycosyltransferase TuaG